MVRYNISGYDTADRPLLYSPPVSGSLPLRMPDSRTSGHLLVGELLALSLFFIFTDIFNKNPSLPDTSTKRDKSALIKSEAVSWSKVWLTRTSGLGRERVTYCATICAIDGSEIFIFHSGHCLELKQILWPVTLIFLHYHSLLPVLQ